MKTNLPKIIAVVGPTASGKSSLAVEVAKAFNGEIISVDSRQIYKGMDIGTNKEVDDAVIHHMIDIINPDEKFTVQDFKEQAEKHIDHILSQGKLPVLVGGTGLYASAILENYQIPDEKGEPKYDALVLIPKVDRDELYERINTRVDEMMVQGLLEEVERLYKEYGKEPHSMTGIGYKQLVAYIENQMTLEEAVEEIKKATRNYAKRQITWWRHHGDAKSVKSKDEALHLVQEFLN